MKTPLTFSAVSIVDIQSEIKALKTNRAFPYMNIPPKQLKELIGLISEPLQSIWNEEIVSKRKFPSELKLADLSPIFKKLETVHKENYRPISVLPVVSKIFERIMDK